MGTSRRKEWSCFSGMALELRGSELPVLGHAKILLNVSNARLHSDTIETHPDPQAEAQAFVLLKDPGGPVIARAMDHWFMETIPPGFHPSLPYQQERRRGSEGEGLTV